jgi:hypothetical protein
MLVKEIDVQVINLVEFTRAQYLDLFHDQRDEVIASQPRVIVV